MLKFLLFCLIILIIFSLVGCSPNRENKKTNEVVDALINSELIREEMFSPNGSYTEQEEDKVYNTVRIYQNGENHITVIADSSSPFFDGLQYDYDCDRKISSSDVEVKWLTLMGSENGSKDDQRIIADIRISVNGDIWSERKINFLKKAIEIVTETQIEQQE